MRTLRAYTMMELLIVLGIIGVLAAIMIPVMASARKRAYEADSISNLRQCGLVLAMYCDDYGGYQSMPSGPVAAELLAKAPTCDRADSWRSSCRQSWGEPLIGSYGYVRYVDPWSTPSGWKDYVNWNSHATVLLSIFYASPVPFPFHGDMPTGSECFEGATMPNRVLRLRLDGSVAMTANSTRYPDGSAICLSWGPLFVFDRPVTRWKTFNLEGADLAGKPEAGHGHSR